MRAYTTQTMQTGKDNETHSNEKKKKTKRTLCVANCQLLMCKFVLQSLHTIRSPTAKYVNHTLVSLTINSKHILVDCDADCDAGAVLFATRKTKIRVY